MGVKILNNIHNLQNDILHVTWDVKHRLLTQYKII